MIDFYLVTGFLGAGKTTFLKNFIRLLAPKKLRLIINEYGKVGVDGELLRNLGAVLDEINNGSIFCSCRLDKFEAVLEDILANPAEAVVVEASGLSDPTAIRTILSSGKYSEFSYKGTICIVDAQNFHKVFKTARVCPKQLSISDIVVINKTDIATPEQIAAVQEIILENYPDAVIHTTTQGNFDADWLTDLGRVRGGEVSSHDRDLTLQKYAITIKPTMTLYQLEHFIRMFAEDTYRIKGFVELENQVYLVDCVGTMISITPWKCEPSLCESSQGESSQGDMPQSVIVALAGKGMNTRKGIKQAVEWYSQHIQSVE